MSRQGCKQIMKVFGLDWKKSVQCLDLDFEVHDECLGAKGVEEVGKKLSSAFLPLLFGGKMSTLLPATTRRSVISRGYAFRQSYFVSLKKRNNHAGV